MANPCKATMERVTQRIEHVLEMLTKFDNVMKEFLVELKEDGCEDEEEIQEFLNSAKEEFAEIEKFKKNVEKERDILDGSRYNTDGMRETYLAMSKAFVDLNNRWKSSVESFDLFAQQAMELTGKVDKTSEQRAAQGAEIPIQASNSKCSQSETTTGQGLDTVNDGIAKRESAQKNPSPSTSMTVVESADNGDSTAGQSISSNGKEYTAAQPYKTGAGEAVRTDENAESDNPATPEPDSIIQTEVDDSLKNLQLKD